MKSLFGGAGVHAIVDGQFGSTGKGALAAWMALQAHNEGAAFALVVSNAGPNSGHTFYDKAGQKHVLKQLPSFAVAQHVNHYGYPAVYLSAGAIIDPDILIAEALKYPGIEIWVDTMAAVITPDDKEAEHSGSIAAVAGTRSGTGHALARKVLREEEAVFHNHFLKSSHIYPANVQIGVPWTRGEEPWFSYRVFLEVSQGFSLGLNSEFYPKVTSRECTVMQGIADARIPPHCVQRVYVSLRTFPIRVGNVDGFSSGDCYPDQQETSWETIKQTPELTTVTQRVRRVFTFSSVQAQEAINANGADFVFLNFMNYLPKEDQGEFLALMEKVADRCYKSFEVIQGYGPTPEDVEW